MHNPGRPLSILALLATLTAGCDKKDSAGSDKNDSKSSADSGPCSGARALSGVVVLEVKGVPDNADEGVKFIDKLQTELASECTAKGYDKSAADALACYEKNKGKPGYRVLKGCDEKVGKDLIAAVVAKHGAK